MNIDTVNDLLIDYVKDTENDINNYKLAIAYQSIGQTAAAISFFLRASERTKNNNLAYECLVRIGHCFDKQGNRNYTVKAMFKTAITLLPHRPEAYYFLSKILEFEKDYFESYTVCQIALEMSKDHTEFDRNLGYSGTWCLLFQKAVAGWWCGRGMESRKLFQYLVNNHWQEIDEVHRSCIENNIVSLGSGPMNHAFCMYENHMHNRLRYKFKGSENITNNYSQVYQDMFILSMLDGKRNGTFLEIGGAEPWVGNNTALLETRFDWTGLSIEFNEKFIANYRNSRPRTKVLHQDALKINYSELLSKNYNSNVIDYLQLDIEPAKNTYECLLKIPFDEYQFRVITYEHDYYADVSRTYREKSREYLKSKGYVLVVGDISPDGVCNFEDWWVNPDLVDPSILSKMFVESSEIKATTDYMFPKNKSLDDIEWGDLSGESRDFIHSEIKHGVYTKYFDVQQGDVVFDIGASVGPFTVSILDKKPKEIHCFEPHNSMFSVMQSNLSDVDNVILNKFAISDKTTRSVHLDSVFSLTKEENEKTVDTITFMDYIKKHNITKIDFLKTDCEGGEWYVFTKENYEWIRNNVKKVTGEFHLHTDEMKKSFIEFRDLYLKNAKNVVAFLSNKFAEIELIDISNDDFVNNNLQYCNISFELESVNFMSINTQPKKTAWIVDNFYEHPDRVRDFALRQEYLEGGLGRGFIGRRTHNQFLFPGLKERFQEIMGKTVTKWQEHGMNGRFQISWSGEPLVYHCDDQRWAGMLYLTPNAPFQCGTTLHGHKVTKARTYYDHGWDAAWRDVPGDPHLDGTPFEPVDVLGNVYNRLVIFDASCIHSASEYFGTVKENARLWQMFFFDAE